MGAPKPPRGLVLATGEEVPEGQSIRARLLIVEMGPGDVDRVILSEYQQASDPALRFLAFLQVALASGRAHVADRQGRAPAQAEVWGWQRNRNGRRWAPQGTRIGWMAGGDLFLDPTASYEVAQELTGAERMPVSEQALRHHLQQQGLLVSVDTGRQMVQVRRTLQGRARQVLHLRASDLVRGVTEAGGTTLSKP